MIEPPLSWLLSIAVLWLKVKCYWVNLYSYSLLISYRALCIKFSSQGIPHSSLMWWMLHSPLSGPEAWVISSASQPQRPLDPCSHLLSALDRALWQRSSLVMSPCVSVSFSRLLLWAWTHYSQLSVKPPVCNIQSGSNKDQFSLWGCLL